MQEIKKLIRRTYIGSEVLYEELKVMLREMVPSCRFKSKRFWFGKNLAYEESNQQLLVTLYGQS